MSVNASLHPSSIVAASFLFECLTSPLGTASMAVGIFIGLSLFLPLGLFIFYLGHRRYSGTMMSHSNFFTYNVVASELLKVPVYILIITGTFAKCKLLVEMSIMVLVGLYYCQILVNVLTCVERYMAVVHPITYMKLRSERRTRVRNAITALTWFLSFGVSCVFIFSTSDIFLMIYFSFYTVVTGVVSFCSVAVLRVLIHPGPGDKAGVRSSIEQSKLRAFHVIVVIFCVLVLKFVCNIVVLVVTKTIGLLKTEGCAFSLIELWFSLPSSLVSPLLFLQRAGKLSCRKTEIKTRNGVD